MRFLLPVGSNLALVISALGYGSMLRPLMPRDFTWIDRVALTLLGGLGFLGTLLFCVGQFSFSRATLALTLILGIVLGLRYLLRETKPPTFHRPPINWMAVPVLIIIAVLSTTALAGLAEPTGDIKMDAIAYHLLAPKVWLRDGLIRPVPDECMTAFPMIVETQFGALMEFGGQAAPQFFAITALVSILFMSASLALHLGLGTGETLWAVALVTTMPVVYRGAYGGFVDAIYSAFVLAALRIVFDAELPTHYMLVGIFCGLAIGTKYFGLIAWALVILCPYVIAVLRNDREPRALIRNLGIACACAIVVGSPWYLRNWIQLGSPIYPPPPLLAHLFRPRYLSPQAIQNFADFFAKVREGMGRGPLAFLLLPIHLTLHPANFMNGAGGIGLAPLALGPFGLPIFRKNRGAQGLVLFAWLQTIAWFALGQDPRYIIHIFVIAAIFAVAGWEYVSKAAPRFGRPLCWLVIACSVSYGLYMICTARFEDMHAVVSSQFAEKRRHDEIPFVESFDYLNRDPAGGKILVLDPRVPTYYLNRTYIKPLGRFGEQSLPHTLSLEPLPRQLASLRISHILDVRQEGESFRLPNPAAGLTLTFEGHGQRVYRAD